MGKIVAAYRAYCNRCGRGRSWRRLGALLLALALPCLHANAATEDALASALKGEFALQSGEGAAAARQYLEAAQKSDDAALAERAAEVALVAHENALAAQALARWRQLDPKSEDLASADAVLALRIGDRANARRELLAILGPDGKGWKRTVRVFSSATDSATSAQVAGDLLRQGRWPTDISAWLAFGALSQRLGDPALTRQIVGEVVRRFPNDPHVWLLEAERLREQNDEVAARRAIERALSLNDGDADVRSAAAAGYALLGDRKAAAATLAAGPQDDRSYIARAGYLAEIDDADGLAKLYDEVKAQSSAPGAARGLLLGQLAEYLKHLDEALAWYRGLPEGPQRDTAQSRIAIVLDARGDLDGALKVLRELQHDDGADGDAQRDSFQVEAELLTKHQRKDEALAAYGRGLAIYDAEPGLLYGRALLLEGMDRIAEAEADLRSIIKTQPENADALNALGYTLADRTQRYAEAQVLIERALRLQPDSPAILDSLGWVQHRLGRDAEALRNLRRAFALQKDAEIAAHLGEVLWLQGDKDGARVVWKQGMAIDKDNRALLRTVQTYKP
jgi:tetratricopeptide (TPR) repeat protein